MCEQQHDAWVIHTAGNRKSTYTGRLETAEHAQSIVDEITFTSPGLRLEVTHYRGSAVVGTETAVSSTGERRQFAM